MRRALALACLAALVAAGEATREDLARALVGFERAYREHPPADEGAVQRAFDRATLAFFRGSLDDVLRGLAKLTARLAPASPESPGLLVRARERVSHGSGTPVETVRLPWEKRTFHLVLHDSGGAERARDPSALPATGPGTYIFSREDAEGRRFEAARAYEIDRSRVYVLGHSMGGAIAAQIADDPRSGVAAAVCMSGARPLQGAVPTLVFAGGLDPLVPASTLEGFAKAGGAAVQYRLFPECGHTLLVPRVLPEAVEWLRTHTREKR